MWKCVKCGERVGSEFRVCWNCGTARDGVEDPLFHKVDETVVVREADDTAVSQNGDVPDQGPVQDAPRQRLGCLTLWLVLVILSNSLTILSLPLGLGDQQSESNLPDWVIWPVLAIAVLNVVFAIALLAWKRWGFFGLVATSLGAFALNIYLGAALTLAVLGLGGVVLMFVLLRIGGRTSAWSQLE